LLPLEEISEIELCGEHPEEEAEPCVGDGGEHDEE